MLMFKDGGFHNFKEGEIEEATKDGWVDGILIRNEALAAKQSKPVAIVEEVATIPVQSEVKRSPGRLSGLQSSIAGRFKWRLDKPS